MDRLSQSHLLVKEVVQALEGARAISPELRSETIQLAIRRGNAPAITLMAEAQKTALDPNRSSFEYIQALRRATVGTQQVPWYGGYHLILALLQYRTGDFEHTLLSAQHAVALWKALAPDAHAVRAMADYRLHDVVQAQQELSLARQAAASTKGTEDSGPFLLEEATALIGPIHHDADSGR